jgi:hypothetical protein
LAFCRLRTPGITCTFMGPQPGGCMNTSGNHEAEKSDRKKSMPFYHC